MIDLATIHGFEAAAGLLLLPLPSNATTLLKFVVDLQLLANSSIVHKQGSSYRSMPFALHPSLSDRINCLRVQPSRQRCSVSLPVLNTDHQARMEKKSRSSPKESSGRSREKAAGGVKKERVGHKRKASKERQETSRRKGKEETKSSLEADNQVHTSTVVDVDDVVSFEEEMEVMALLESEKLEEGKWRKKAEK